MIDSIDTEFAVEQYKMETKYKEGQIKERRKNAKAFKKLGLPLETIAQGTGLSVAEIKKL